MEQQQPSLADRADYENAARGFIATREPCIIRNNEGRIVWNAEEYNFLNGHVNAEPPCPATVNPKLWRHAQLTSKHGLFRVTEGTYQVRGFDLSNMTIVEGKTGILVIDPLVSIECAAAALSLYRTHRGPRPIRGLIYSHSHIDHYGGAEGVLPTDAEQRSKIPILAPDGFLDEAASENIYLGPAMRRRAGYMYGSRLPRDPEGQGQVGCGIGMAVSTGSNSLIPPTVYIRQTGEERIVDGIRMVFQMVPGAEAPSEMNFYFPSQTAGQSAFYIAECATHAMHNIITLRGALVRDAKAWARYLDESLVLFGEKSDALLAGHHWPVWGKAQITELLSEQRDLYAYMHDQTVRMMNRGMNGAEIAEVLTLPPKLASAWHVQGFYGSLSHNVKGVYQRYMGWFDGNPARLWEHPAAENARRYVDCMGGVDDVVQKARGYIEGGDLRFAATLLSHAVTVEPKHAAARTALGDVYKQLGYGAENATWRNFYLTGAMALLHHDGMRSLQIASDKSLQSTDSFEQWLEVLSVRLDGLQAACESIVIDILVTDENRWWRVIVSNGALTYRTASDQAELGEPAELSLSGTKTQMHGILNGDVHLKDTSRSGNWNLLFRLLQLTGMTGATELESSHL
jgi:alkyl sulfatase BDS1-like metallo-beta-lactamase superfamily hydrolase